MKNGLSRRLYSRKFARKIQGSVEVIHLMSLIREGLVC